MEKIKKYLRHDNWKTWLTMGTSLVFCFISAIINTIYIANKGIFYGLFVVSIIAFFVFVFASYKYVDKWHGILSILQKWNSSMLNTCAFLAAMEKTEDINKDLRVSEIIIRYSFEQEPYQREGFWYYPFHLTYEINSIVKKSFDKLHFHVLGHRHEQITVDINDKKVKNTRVSKKGNLQTYTFSDSSPFLKDHPLKYKIDMDFDGAAGLAAGREQQFLFYPRNISTSYANKNNVRLELNFPNALYQEYIKKQFDVPYLQKYKNGFRKEESEENPGPTKEKRGKRVIEYWDIEIPEDEIDALFVIEFKARAAKG